MAVVGQGAVREYRGRMGAWPLPCVACGSLVSDKLMMTLNHLPLTIMSRHSAILPVSYTGECVGFKCPFGQKLRKLHGEN